MVTPLAFPPATTATTTTESPAAGERQRYINMGRDPDNMPTDGDRVAANNIINPMLADQEAQRGLINEFYQSPERMREINSAIDAQETVQQTQMQDAFLARQRQEAFARARSGNVGGSVEAEQNAGLSADAFRDAAALEENVRVAREQAAQQLEAARVQEIMDTYEMDPYTQAALQEQQVGLGQDADAAQVQAAQTRREQQMQRFFNDELSRIIGSAVNTVSNAVRMNYYAQAEGKQGLW